MRFDNLTVRTKASATEVKSALAAESTAGPPPADRRTQPKFADCLPPELLARYAWTRLYNWTAAKQIRENPIVPTKN